VVVMLKRKIAARAMNACDILKFMRGIVSWHGLARNWATEKQRQD